MPDILSVTVADQFTNTDTAIPFAAISKECGHTCPLGQRMALTYDGGTDAVGVAIRVSEAANAFAFTGLVALYVPGNSPDPVIALVLYSGESLVTPGIGTALVVVAQTLSVNDVLEIKADTTNPERYFVLVNSVQIINHVVSSDDIPTTNPCVAIIEVADVGGDLTPTTEDVALIATQSADQSLTVDTMTDSELLLALEANKTYVGHAAVVLESASSTPDADVQWVGPAAAEALIVDVAFNYEAIAIAVDKKINITGGTPTVIHYDITVRMGATAGDFKFQFCQFLADATATTLKKDSHLILFEKT